MLPIEEYIARRKKEDRINEFDADQRNENMRVCVNYVFEYFNNYLNISEAEERTVLKDERIDTYRKELQDYDQEVRAWLIGIYKDYEKRLNRDIGRLLKEDKFYFLYNSDKEFRCLSYDCYANLIKKCPYLKDQAEMLFILIKDYHRIKSQISWENNKNFISEVIDEWVQETWVKYHVNIFLFVDKWVEYFSTNEDIWPTTHRIKTNDEYFKYEYNYKQKSNLFNLDSLYRKLPKKPYTKGRKQEFEIIMMYFWLHSIESDDNYWQEYLHKALSKLKDENLFN